MLTSQYNTIVFHYFRPLLKEIQNSTETRIVMRCSAENILPILRKARSLNLMGDYYAYVIISLVKTNSIYESPLCINTKKNVNS